jgi:hypothetical protein
MPFVKSSIWDSERVKQSPREEGTVTIYKYSDLYVFTEGNPVIGYKVDDSYAD